MMATSHYENHILYVKRSNGNNTKLAMLTSSLSVLEERNFI